MQDSKDDEKGHVTPAEGPNPTEKILRVDRTPVSGHVLPTKGLRLTPESLELIRTRVKWIALLSIGLCVFGVLAALILLSSVETDVLGAVFNAVTQTICLTYAAFVWITARGTRMSNTTVLYLGLTLEVLLCLVPCHTSCVG